MAIFAVMAFPRTGSSMTAGILAQHGVWTGEYRHGDDINAKGHFENLHFKQIVKKYKKTGIHRKPVFDPDQCFLDDFMLIQPTDPWLIKASAKYWRLFDSLDPIYLCVRRDRQETINSCKRVKLYFNGIEKSYDEHMYILDEIVRHKNGINIDTQSVIDRDYSSLVEAFDRSGIEFKKKKADEFVDGRLWHFNNRED